MARNENFILNTICIEGFNDLGTVNFNMKAGNMKTEQNFTSHPYEGGKKVLIQSDRRIAHLELATGKFMLSGRNTKTPSIRDLSREVLFCKIDPVNMVRLKQMIVSGIDPTNPNQ